jgi:peptide/nickel transport system substrate-binding protein
MPRRDYSCSIGARLTESPARGQTRMHHSFKDAATMTGIRCVTRQACLAALMLVLLGCSKDPIKESASGGEREDSGGAETAKSESTKKEKPADAEFEIPVQPADLPTLAELDEKAGWIDQPVKDTFEMLLEKQAAEPPLATVAEALALRNTSRDANEKVLNALGRAKRDESQIDYDAVINRHFRRDVKSTNPVMFNTVEENELGTLIGITLLAFDWNLAPVGDREIIRSWQISKDRMLDKIVMRDDLTWSDGKPVTAHDVVFSFLTIMNPKVPVPAVRSGTDKLRWVHAYDDHTLVFFHKEALATNVWNVIFPIIPRHVYEKSVVEDPTMQEIDYHVALENSPISCGPYVISKRQRGQEFVLTRRESWYMHGGKQVRDKPYFKEVRMQVIEDLNTALRALRNGELDEMILNPEQWVTQTGDDDFYRLNTKVSGLEWTYFHFEWNVETPYFSDLKVRQAMSFAFDYKEMHDTLNYGLYERCNGIFHPTSWMAPKNPPAYYEQNLDRAEQLLDEAGWTDHDGDGIRDKTIGGRQVPFEFSILVPPVPDRVKICTLLKENLGQIGITCNVSQLEATVILDKLLKHEFQAAFGGWSTGADPDTSENIWGTGQGRNFGYYSNPEVDRLYEVARHEFDRQKRGEIYGRIHELIFADQPATWLYFRNAFYAFNKNLRGYMFSPRGPFGYSPGFGSVYKIKN